MIDINLIGLPLWLTLKIAFCAIGINAVLAVGWAYCLVFYRVPAKSFFEALSTLPMVLPPTVLGYYLLVLMGRHGVVGEWLQSFGINLIFTWQGAVVAAVLASFPLVFKSAQAALASVNLNHRLAAQTLGLSNSAIFFRVTLPLAWQGCFAGLILGFCRCVGEFGATLMVAGAIPGKTQTLSTAIYEAVQAGQSQLANTLVLLTTVICLILLMFANRLFSGYWNLR